VNVVVCVWAGGGGLRQTSRCQCKVHFAECTILMLHTALIHLSRQHRVILQIVCCSDRYGTWFVIYS
jgi:hypothetical protein